LCPDWLWGPPDLMGHGTAVLIYCSLSFLSCTHYGVKLLYI
jgi:hypothetical protein